MRIAYICMDRGVPAYGWRGSSIHVQDVMRAFIAQGAGVELFAASVDDAPPADLAQVVVDRIQVPRDGPRAARERAALVANRDLRSALEAATPFDLVYERYSLWSHAGMEFAHEKGIPGVLEVNAPLIDEQARYRGLADRSGAERTAVRTFSASRVIVAVSNEIAAYLDTYPCTRGQVVVVPNGVDPNRFPLKPRDASPALRHVWSVGFVGTLKPWHGLSTLLEGFAILHRTHADTRLVIVGDGPERVHVEARADALGVRDAVRLTGAVAPGQVPGLLASMDVAAAPYPNLPDFHFSPLKVFEYMAAGLPVVASRIGQIAEVIRDGENGLLCPPGDPSAFAAALCRVKQEPDLGARLGRAARALVIRDYTWDRVACRVLHLAGVHPQPARLEAASIS